MQAHFDTGTLAQRVKPITDHLREHQRDALVAYLTDKHNLRDAEGLYDHLLIDVKMGACMRTSRIRQAISAIQLFVERCLMNLENEVQPSSIDTSRWQWMQSYRVWEANRKVFLYPENWIEPELRDDKSEIFRALESDLLQTELNHEQAAVAFRKFIERFLDISHLTVASMFEEHQFEEPQFDKTRKLTKTIVHLVGRDGEKPYRYFYRQWHISPDGATSWTPWEEITLQINSDHVLVYVSRSRLYLAWPTISKLSQDKWQIGLSLGRQQHQGGPV